MENLDLQQTLKKYHEMISSGAILGWKDWMGLSENLLWQAYQQEEERSAREMEAHKKLKEIRPNYKSNSDAGIEWKTTEEYKRWQNWEKLIKSINGFAAITRNKANMLNKF